MPTPFIKRLRDNASADFLVLVPENPNTVHPVIEPIARPNVPGFAFRKLAPKSEPFRVFCMRNFGNMGAARAAAQSLRDNLVGEMCLIGTRDGTQYTRMMCLDVREGPVNEVLNLVGGLSTGSGNTIFSLPAPADDRQAMARFQIEFVHAGYANT